jgi:hypothetical protein
MDNCCEKHNTAGTGRRWPSIVIKPSLLVSTVGEIDQSIQMLDFVRKCQALQALAVKHCKKVKMTEKYTYCDLQVGCQGALPCSHIARSNLARVVQAQ